MPVCPHCGKEAGEGSTFCAGCGQRLIGFTPEERRKYIEELKATVKEEKRAKNELGKGKTAGIEERPLMTAQCLSGSLELYENKLRIKRKGASAFMLHGLKGDKDIFLSQISAIQVKKPGSMTNGYIQFSFVGGQESKTGIFSAVQDENTLMFTSSQQKEVEAFKAAVEQRLFARKPSPEPTSYLNDLEKLHELKAKGIITEEEFNRKKRQILGD